MHKYEIADDHAKDDHLFKFKNQCHELVEALSKNDLIMQTFFYEKKWEKRLKEI